MPAREFKNFTKAMEKASLLAQRDLSTLWNKIETLDPYAQRNALLALVPGIVYKYGQIAALAAAEYYENERAYWRGDEDYEVELADGVPYEQIEASVRYAAGHLFKDNADGEVQSERNASLFSRQD